MRMLTDCIVKRIHGGNNKDGIIYESFFHLCINFFRLSLAKLYKLMIEYSFLTKNRNFSFQLDSPNEFYDESKKKIVP